MTSALSETATKFTAAQVLQQDCPQPLQDLQKRIAAHLEKAGQYQAKAEQHHTTAGRLFAQVRESCDEGGFAAFHEKFFPNLGRSRAYELLAIGVGKKTIEEIRADTRERVARHRAAKGESVTVTDSGSTRSSESAAPEDDAASSAEKRKAAYAAAETGENTEVAAPQPRASEPANSDRKLELVDVGSADAGPADAGRADAPDRAARSQTDAPIPTDVPGQADTDRADAPNQADVPAPTDAAQSETLAEHWKRLPREERTVFLDAIGVADLREVWSAEFSQALRAELPADPFLKLAGMDAFEAAEKVRDVLGSAKARVFAAKLQTLLEPKSGKSSKSFNKTLNLVAIDSAQPRDHRSGDDAGKRDARPKRASR